MLAASEGIVNSISSGVGHYSRGNRGTGAPGTKLSKAEYLATGIKHRDRRIEDQLCTE
jgi:hypothetical protein